jgi:hypothetical protein
MQGRPLLRRTSVRRHTQKIRPSMLPLAALTAAGSASANSLNEVRIKIGRKLHQKGTMKGSPLAAHLCRS